MRFSLLEMHVGLNLVYLVPGETGGMEVVARELIPELAEIPGVRLTAFVNREAEQAGGGPWEGSSPSVTVPVHAHNRFAWVPESSATSPSGRRGRL